MSDDFRGAFVLKIANFRCHGNKSMSKPNVTGIVELADPENHTMEHPVAYITIAHADPKCSINFFSENLTELFPCRRAVHQMHRLSL